MPFRSGLRKGWLSCLLYSCTLLDSPTFPGSGLQVTEQETIRGGNAAIQQPSKGSHQLSATVFPKTSLCPVAQAQRTVRNCSWLNLDHQKPLITSVLAEKGIKSHKKYLQRPLSILSVHISTVAVLM